MAWEIDLERSPSRPVFRTVGILIGYSLALSGLKFWMAGLTLSEAVRSDGWNNFADALYSILLGIGFMISARLSDESHPRGHRRFESMIGLAVGLIILATGGYILIECRRRWLESITPNPNAWVLTGLFALMLSKIWIARLCRRTGEQLHRPVLVAVGKDQQMDIFATLSAIIGYGGGVWWSPMLDPVFGGIISLWVFKVGGETVYDYLHQLTGKPSHPAT